MALLKFFRVPKHQRYEYKPRFWDPRKEELQKRLDQIQSMKEGGVAATKSRIAGGFKRGYAANNRVRKGQVLRSNIILLSIVVMLLVLCYLFITKYLPKIAEALENGSQI